MNENSKYLKLVLLLLVFNGFSLSGTLIHGIVATLADPTDMAIYWERHYDDTDALDKKQDYIS